MTHNQRIEKVLATRIPDPSQPGKEGEKHIDKYHTPNCNQCLRFKAGLSDKRCIGYRLLTTKPKSRPSEDARIVCPLWTNVRWTFFVKGWHEGVFVRIQTEGSSIQIVVGSMDGYERVVYNCYSDCE